MAHVLAIAKAATQQRKIRLIKATGMVGEGLSNLSKKQLVEKASLVLAMMVEGTGNKPVEVRFIGANKERGQGGVTYELNSMEATDWIKERTIMSNFLENMGSTTDYKEQTYKVVMDWVPIMLNIEQAKGWRAIEQASGLKELVIKDITWIKPMHLQVAGQKTMIAVFRMASREDTNQVIEGGLYMEGKKVWGRKQMQEPRRCLKCQCFGKHKAAKCRSIHEVCGRCSMHHWTSLCSENERDSLACSNCKAANNNRHMGHGAVDRRCPIFLD